MPAAGLVRPKQDGPVARVALTGTFPSPRIRAAMNAELVPVLRRLLTTDAGRLHPLQVLARFGYLQVRRRLVSKPSFFTTVTGTRAFIDSRGDFTGITGLFYMQLPTLNEVVFACHCLRPGDVLWDVGANQGFWSLLLAGRQVEAHAFEPAPTTFANLRRQFDLQSAPVRDLLHGHNVGLAARPGQMRLTVDLGTAIYLLNEGQAYAGDSVTVGATTADALQSQLRPPQLIKIDVEGRTLPVLEGGQQILARPDLLALVIETFRSADGDKPEMRSIESLLDRFGFRPFSYDPRRRSLHPLTTSREGRDDTIYVRDPERLAARLTSAPPISCFGDQF